MNKLTKKDLELWSELTKNIKKLKQETSFNHEVSYDIKKLQKVKIESEIAYEKTMLKQNLTNTNFNISHAQSSEDTIYAARNSIDSKLQLKLKQGKFAYQAKLDLHGLTITKAQEQLIYFLQKSHKNGLKCVLIIHGKGKSSETKLGQIKQQIPYWLESINCVLAFCSAQNKHGGSGAMYVLLKTKKQ